MLTQCPGCGHEFDFLPEIGQRDGACPACARRCTFRSLDVLRAIEHEHRKRIASGVLKGGPVPAGDRQVQFFALLEDIRSLWNVGSMFRTADAAGIQQLYLCGFTGCPPRKEIAKTSLGAETYVSWEYHRNSLDIILQLKEQGVCIVASEYTEDSKLLSDIIASGCLSTPLCLVVGNEDSGVSTQVLSVCDYVCHLPMRGIKTSLNVAVAFGIASFFIAEKFTLKGVTSANSD